MPQKPQIRLAQLRVGLLVTASVAVIILVIFWISDDSSPFTERTLLKSYFSGVQGLRVGAEVRLSGVGIGSVKELNFRNQIPATPTQPDYVEVVMEVSGELDGRPAVERIRSDSRAYLETAGVLGDNVINITPGSLAGAPIKPGGVIEGVSKPSVGDILSTAQTAMGNLNAVSDDIKAVTGRIRAGAGTAGRFLNDEEVYVNLNHTIQQAERLLYEVRRGPGTAGRLISDPALYGQITNVAARFERIATQLDEQLSTGQGTLGKLLKDEQLYNRADSLLAELNAGAADLSQLTTQIRRGEGTVGKLVNDEAVYADLRAAANDLRTLTARLERGEGTAGLLLKDPRLYNNVNTLSTELVKLLYDFRQNPKKYLDIDLEIF
jgi:phospholipid/cholesterol/gamma-HCH transport system substrate-binding protein